MGHLRTDGNINGDIICNFVERCLVPILWAFNGTNASLRTVVDPESRCNCSTLEP